MSAAGAIYGLAAAALFGAGAPFAKLLLGRVQPLMLSALLYLGAGVALSGLRQISGAVPGLRHESSVGRTDIAAICGVILFGGVFGPLLLLVGLSHISALCGSLLLNLEMPFTIALALVFFGEHIGVREAAAAMLILGGVVLLGYAPGGLSADRSGIIAVAGACACWALDNNLSQRLSLRSPVIVAQIKTAAAGAISLTIALAAGQRLPEFSIVGAALTLGAVSYGLSLVAALMSLRLLGAAREVALFATAPFIGAMFSVAVLHESPRRTDFAAALAMIAGVAWLLRERHGHPHEHLELEHEHLHHHDAHHQHPHQPPHSDGDTYAQPHSHPHRHQPLTHQHPHTPDAHHRHRHP